MAVVGGLAPDASAVVGRQHEQAVRSAGPARFVGSDGWPGGEHAADVLRDKLASRADAASGPVLVFRRPCLEVAEFTMPRTVDPELLALWRLPVSRSPAAERGGPDS